MILVISRSLLDTIVADCARDPHRERCGLLLGSDAHVLAVRPAANVAPDPATEFEIAPGALIEAVRAARGGDLAVIGHYHSHPNGLAQPSARDAVAAAGDGGRYWLIVTDTHASAWHFTGEGAVEGFDAVALAITGDET